MDKQTTPRSHTHCWFKTKENEHYVGQLTSDKFTDKKISLSFSKIVRVGEGEKPRWHTIDKVSEGRKIEFEGCVVEINSFLSIHAKSSFGETIILTSKKEDTEKIDKLLIDGVVEIDKPLINDN